MSVSRFNMLMVTILLLSGSAQADWGLYVSPYFSEFTDVQRLPSGPIFAGTQGGVSVSLDEGSTWHFTGLGSLDDPNAGNAVHFDAVELDNGEVYVLMENTYRADPGYTSFTRAAWPPVLENVEASGDTVWVATHDTIYRSLDSGANWTQVYTAQNGGDTFDRMLRNPVSGVLIMEWLRPGGLRLVVSEDGGLTWTERTLSGVFGELFGLTYGADGTLWIGHNYLNRGTLRSSTDNGATTTVVYTAPSNTELGDLTLGPATRMAMTQGAGMVVSLNGGGTFETRTAPAAHPEPLFFTGGERLLAGTSDGLMISEDEGLSWTAAAVDPWANIMNDADVAPDGTSWIHSSGRIWHDAAGAWTRLPMPGGPSQQVHVLRVTSSGRVLVLGLASGVPEIWYTDDRGGSWNTAAGLDGLSSWSRFENVIESGGVLYAGHAGLGLLVSTNDGASWTQRAAEAVGDVQRAGDGTLWAAGASGLRKSTDGGFVWSSIGAVSPLGAGTASPTGGAFIVPTWLELSRTLDGGATWTDVLLGASNLLFNQNIWLMEVQALSYAADGALLLSVQVDDNTQHRRGTRLLRSEDDGDTWTDITPDGPLRHAVVQSLKRSAEGMLIACSNLGLFGEDLGANVAIDDPFIGSAPPEAPVSFLGRNHPNPFNPRTTIPFALARPGAVRLEVYDLRGARRATLVDERLTAGRHEVEFDGRGLGSGTYMYRLEADGLVRSGRMTLVK